MAVASLCMVAFGLLFRAIRVNDIRALASASLFGCFLVFTHPWTLDQYLAGLVPLRGLRNLHYDVGSRKPMTSVMG